MIYTLKRQINYYTCTQTIDCEDLMKRPGIFRAAYLLLTAVEVNATLSSLWWLWNNLQRQKDEKHASVKFSTRNNSVSSGFHKSSLEIRLFGSSPQGHSTTKSQFQTTNKCQLSLAAFCWQNSLNAPRTHLCFGCQWTVAFFTSASGFYLHNMLLLGENKLWGRASFKVGSVVPDLGLAWQQYWLHYCESCVYWKYYPKSLWYWTKSEITQTLPARTTLSFHGLVDPCEELEHEIAFCSSENSKNLMGALQKIPVLAPQVFLFQEGPKL